MKKKEIMHAIGEQLFPGWKRINGVGAIMYRMVSDKNPIIQISFSLSERSDGYNLGDSFIGFAKILEVENILERYYRKFNLSNDLLTIIYPSKRHVGLRDIILTSPQELDKVIPHLHGMVYDDVIPFLSQFDTVQKVYDHMESLGPDNMGRFIRAPMPLRRMIIYGLVKAPAFEEYAARVMHVNRVGGNRPEFFSPFLPELYDELKAMQ